MADSLLGASQSSLLRLQPHLGFQNRFSSAIQRLPVCKPVCYNRLIVSSDRHRHFRDVLAPRVVSSDFKSSTIISNSVDSASEGIDIEPVTGGGGGDNFGDASGGGGGGDNSGGGGGGGDSGNEGEGGESSGDSKKTMALSMSQKLTIAYAALVGVGGLMGYLKSGSSKSLLAGGTSAAILFYVYTQLPTNPFLASSIGFAMSAALLGVMGSRFMKSKKIMPAGVVAFVSFVMTGGYLHGIMRTLH